MLLFHGENVDLVLRNVLVNQRLDVLDLLHLRHEAVGFGLPAFKVLALRHDALSAHERLFGQRRLKSSDGPTARLGVSVPPLQTRHFAVQDGRGRLGLLDEAHLRHRVLGLRIGQLLCVVRLRIVVDGPQPAGVLLVGHDDGGFFGRSDSFRFLNCGLILCGVQRQADQVLQSRLVVSLGVLLPPDNAPVSTRLHILLFEGVDLLVCLILALKEVVVLVIL